MVTRVELSGESVVHRRLSPWPALRHVRCAAGSGRGGVENNTRRGLSTILIQSRVRRTRVEGCWHALLLRAALRQMVTRLELFGESVVHRRLSPWPALRHVRCAAGSGRGGVENNTRRGLSTVLIQSRVRRTRVEGCWHALPGPPFDTSAARPARDEAVWRTTRGEGSQRSSSRAGSEGPVSKDVGTRSLARPSTRPLRGRLRTRRCGEQHEARALNGPHPEPGPKDPCRGMLARAPWPALRHVRCAAGSGRGGVENNTRRGLSTVLIQSRVRRTRVEGCWHALPGPPFDTSAARPAQDEAVWRTTRGEGSQRSSSRAGSEGPVSRDAGARSFFERRSARS